VLESRAVAKTFYRLKMRFLRRTAKLALTFLHLLVKAIERLKQGSSKLVAYDLGAGAGFFTLLISRYLGREGKVYAFEPFRENIEILRAHIALNKIINVEIIEMAISDRAGKGNLLLSEPTLRERGRLVASRALKDSYEVSVTTLDGLIEEKNLEPPSIIKMDIEGEEYRALKGGKDTILRSRPIIFIAIHDINLMDLKTAYETLRNYDYEVFDLKGNIQNLPNDIVSLHQRGLAGECVALPQMVNTEVHRALWPNKAKS